MREIADLLRSVAQTMALIAEALGTVIVAVALVRAVWWYLRDLLSQVTPFPRERIRLNVGRSLALSLEFLLAADILRTAVEPTWNEIARLAAIAAIRTMLNFFLQRELAAEEQRVARGGPDPAG